MADIQTSIVAPVTQTDAATSVVNTTSSGAVKRKMTGVLGAIILSATLGYIVLVIHSVHASNPATSGALISGFILFVNKLIDNFTKWMET